MTTIYEQLQAERAFQRWVDGYADPDPIPVAVTVRQPVTAFIEPARAQQPVSSDDQCAAPLLEPAGMDRGS